MQILVVFMEPPEDACRITLMGENMGLIQFCVDGVAF